MGDIINYDIDNVVRGRIVSVSIKLMMKNLVVSELLSMNISSVNLEVSIPYLRIYGKGDKERIVAITDKTAEHQKDYLKVYHEVIDPDAPLIYTVIKGHKESIRIFRNAAIRICSAGPGRLICIRMEQNLNSFPVYWGIPQLRQHVFMQFLQLI